MKDEVSPFNLVLKYVMLH